MRRYWIFVTLWFALACTPCYAGGLLGKVRKEVSSQPSKKSAQRKSDDNDENDDRGGNSGAGVLAGVSKAVRHKNRRQKSERPGRRQPPRPARSPRPLRSPRRSRVHAGVGVHGGWCEPVWRDTEIYVGECYPTETIYVEQQPCPPPIIMQTPVVEPHVETPVVLPWRTRLEAEYGNNLGEVNALGFGLLAQKPSSIGFDTSLRLFREDYLDQRDHLWLGDANVTYELLNEENFLVRAGVGLNWMADTYGAAAGLNLTLGGELFVTPAVVLSADTDFGNLGDADLFHGCATVGYQVKQMEWFAGYDHLDVAGVQIRSLITGLRFRF